MKSLVSVANTTGEPIVLGDLTFPVGTPVVVYRNAVFFGDGEVVGKFIGHVAEGELLGYSFSGTPNLADDSIVTINFLMNQIAQLLLMPSYSFEYHWNKATCIDMLDGLQKQLNAFNFAEATVSRADVMVSSGLVITLLGAGFLSDAAMGLSAITPDGDAEFLSAARLGQFAALFQSALETVE